MDWNTFIVAIAFVLLIEGLIPAIAPLRWQKSMAMISKQPAVKLRQYGLILVSIGLLILLKVWE